MIRRGFHLGQISSDRMFLSSDGCFRFLLPVDALNLYSTLNLLLLCFLPSVFLTITVLSRVAMGQICH